MKLSRKDLLDTIVPGFIIDVNKNNRFYVNPSTGRTIKSGSKTFKSLKQKKIKINKHRCLYDINSAKQCLKNILNKYAGLYPPSSFINIPLTLDKRGELDYIRAFIRDKDLLKGFIKKDGSLYKFRKNIKFDKNKKYPIVKYASKNDNKKLLEKLDSEGIKVTKKIQKKINKFIYDVNPRCDTINILYNPIQQDFIPINEKKGKMPFSDRKKILDEINNTLIPDKLQGVFDSSISGILKSSKNENNILGYVDDKNNIKLFKEPVEIILQKENKENKENREKNKNQEIIPRALSLSDIELPSELELSTELEALYPSVLYEDLEPINLSNVLFDKIPRVINFSEDSLNNSDSFVLNEERNDFIQNLKDICKENKKCIKSCNGYNLLWDDKYKRCKKIRKNYKPIKFIVDNYGNKIGYTNKY